MYALCIRTHTGIACLIRRLAGLLMSCHAPYAHGKHLYTSDIYKYTSVYTLIHIPQDFDASRGNWLRVLLDTSNCPCISSCAAAIIFGHERESELELQRIMYVYAIVSGCRSDGFIDYS